MAGENQEALAPEQEAEKERTLSLIEEFAGGLGEHRQAFENVLVVLSKDGKLPELKGVKRSPNHPWVNPEGRAIEEFELFND